MKSILENLNRSVGVIGSAVVTPDGMLVASAIADSSEPLGAGGHDQDALAAIASSLVLSAGRSLKRLGADMSVMTVDGSRGKIVLVNADRTFLLVITDSGISLDATMIDIRVAVERLQRRISLDA
jgi:predicted regulator of Ras-like GTPase activity (Roadblock/LC7/MglB family)